MAWGEPDAGPLFEGRPAEPGLAYVCQGRACQMPAADAATLAGQLESLIAMSGPPGSGDGQHAERDAARVVAAAPTTASTDR